MITPQTISEFLMFSTIRIQTSFGTWTWFFLNFNVNNLIIPIIITNKHVINYNKNQNVNFCLHLKNKEWNIEKENITYNTEWFFHEDESIDLCFTFAYWLFEQIKSNLWKEVYYTYIEEELIFDNEKLLSLSAIEELIMVWYPIWIWDEKNNLPIFRKWITATHPAIDFNNESIWLIDMACFPWSSWSPIFILNENWYTDKSWTTHLWAKRIIFIWVLFSGPQYNSNWEIKIENIPTNKQKLSAITPIMINLWYYIKAKEILSFKSYIKNILDENWQIKN